MTHDNSADVKAGEILQTELAGLLDKALPGAVISFRHDTHKHLDHNEMIDHHGAHFFVTIVWDGFGGMARLARHRHVHRLLAVQWGTRQIHSLSLRLMTEDEARA